MRWPRYRLFGLLLAAGLLLTAAGQVSVAQERPEVIVISVNSLNADHLSCYGYHRNTTPNICSLAADGILYENATAAHRWTTPSTVTTFTGLYPGAHGVHLEPGQRNGTAGLPAGIPTLAGLLAQQGYRTSAHVPIGPWLIPEDSNLLRGFEHQEQADTIDHIVSTLLNQTGPGPRFTYAHPKDLHWSYEFPDDRMEQPGYTGGYVSDYDGLFDDWTNDELYELNGAFRMDDNGSVWVNTGDMDYALSDRDVQYFRNRYDTVLRRLDARIGDLIRGLRRQGRYEDALIVVMAPHGEGMADHRGALFSHTEATPGVTEVPLIIKPPGGTRPRRISGMVEGVDVFPTVLSLAGIPVPPHVQGEARTGADEGARYAHTATYRVQDADWIYHGPRSSIGPALYRRGGQRTPRRDRSEGRPDVTARLRAELEGWRSGNRLLHARLSE